MTNAELKGMFKEMANSFAVWKEVKREPLSTIAVYKVVEGEFCNLITNNYIDIENGKLVCKKHIGELSPSSKLKPGDLVAAHELDVITLEHYTTKERIYRFIENDWYNN